MKVCKLVHINDGNEVEVRNGGRLFVETYPNTEIIINMYLEKGFTVKQIMPDVTPNINSPGSYSFFKGGVVVYFEKEVDSIEEADDSDIRDYIENLETQYDREHAVSEEDFEFCEDDFVFDEDDDEMFLYDDVEDEEE